MKKSNAAKPKPRSARGESLIPDEPVTLERIRRHSTVVPRERPVASVSSRPGPSMRPPAGPRPWDRHDIELFCPFQSGLNPHVDVAQRESVNWAVRLRLVPKAARQRLDAARIAWLSAYVFHDAEPEILQLAADWTTLFCLLDDHVESKKLGPVRISAELSRLVAGFRRSSAATADPLDSALLDLRVRMNELADPSWIERFATALEEIFGAFLWEEINRWKQIRPSYSAYRTMRPITVGLRPQYLLGELASGAELPGALRTDAQLQRLESTVALSVGWANDIFTHAKELEAGEVHNLVFVLMEADSLPLAQAMRRAAAMHDEEVRSFLSVQSQLPDFGDDDDRARSYVAMLRNWIRGHLDWAYRTGRYGAPVSTSVLADPR
jgi:5-epi-alpha-selinene synthase